jgi:hypothetical protein
MKLHEIISINEDYKKSILIELMVPYKESLLTYYNNFFNCPPCLIIISITNATSYGKIVPIEEFNEAILEYISDEDWTEEEIEGYIELVGAQSMMLEDL